MSKYLTDYLPIKNPLEHKSDIDFYTAIVKPLVEDVTKLANVGIPVDLDKIQELEKVLDLTIKDHTEKLLNNKIIKYFSEAKNRSVLQDRVSEGIKPLEDKKDALELNLTRIRHINILVDVVIEELISNNILSDKYRRNNDKDNWTVKKLKTIHLLTNSIAIKKLADKEYDSSVLNSYKEKALLVLQNEIDEQIKEKKEKIIASNEFIFNPKSSSQIRELFEYLGIQSRFKTDKGSDSFDKKALLELLDLLNTRLNNEKD